MRRTFFFLIATSVMLVGLVPLPTANAYHEDCTETGSNTVTWSDPRTNDYYNLWESTLGHSPTSSIGASVRIGCHLNSFGIVGTACGPYSACTKFWAYHEVDSGSPGTLTSRSCGQVLVSGTTGGTIALSVVTTPVTDGVLCEAYCGQGNGPCTVGNTVTVTMGLYLYYDWEASDLPALPGSHTYTWFHASNRYGTFFYDEHDTCQAGTSLTTALC